MNLGKLSSVPEIRKRVQPFVYHEDDVSASSSVTAVRSPVRHIFLTAEADMAISALSRFYNNGCSVCKHNFLLQ